jgi:hypothetical protein
MSLISRCHVFLALVCCGGKEVLDEDATVDATFAHDAAPPYYFDAHLGECCFPYGGVGHPCCPDSGRLVRLDSGVPPPPCDAGPKPYLQCGVDAVCGIPQENPTSSDCCYGELHGLSRTAMSRNHERSSLLVRPGTRRREIRCSPSKILASARGSGSFFMAAPPRCRPGTRATLSMAQAFPPGPMTLASGWRAGGPMRVARGRHGEILCNYGNI